MSVEDAEIIAQRPLSLLFVDDDPILREFARVNLAAEGWAVAVAGDGEEALREIARACPDIVLLDLRMPKMDGFQVLHALRERELTRRLPVIVITGRDDEASIDRAFSEGATSFLVKPINWRQLSYQIRFVDRANRNELTLIERADELALQRRELEETSVELSRALDAADAASTTKSHFLATMSHELRTPLNAVIGFAEILTTEVYGALGDVRYRDFARDILGSGRRLLALVNDVLEFSRAAEKSALNEEEFELAELVEEARRAVARQAREARLQLHVLEDPHGTVIRADPIRMTRILTNLLSNAINYTPSDGKITIGTAISGAGISITVSDTGIGIAAEDIATVLEHFGRIGSSLSQQHEGAGLGLPIARQFIELHNGALTIDSTPGQGTAVTITLPKDRLVRLGAASVTASPEVQAA